MVATNVGLQMLDGWVTLQGLGLGFSEGNPLLRRVIELAGPTQGILAMKLLAIAALYLIYRSGRRQLAIGALAGLAVVYTLFAIVPWTLLLAVAPG